MAEWAATFRMSFIDEDPFALSFEEVVVVHDGFDPYPGPYVVIPKRRDQTLETKDKTMEHDVTVKEVPWTEVSNMAGGTTYSIAND